MKTVEVKIDMDHIVSLLQSNENDEVDAAIVHFMWATEDKTIKPLFTVSEATEMVRKIMNKYDGESFPNHYSLFCWQCIFPQDGRTFRMEFTLKGFEDIMPEALA